VAQVTRIQKYGWGFTLALAFTVSSVYTFILGAWSAERNSVVIPTGFAIAAVLAAFFSIMSLESEDRGRRIWEPLVLMPLFGLVAFLVAPIFIRDDRPQKSHCISNVKQLSAALLLYMDDNNGYAPPITSWRAELEDYKEGLQSLKCKLTDAPYTYALNEATQGVRLNKVKAPEELVAIFESKSEHLNASGGPRDFVFRHEGSGNIGYADGHVKSSKPGHAKTRWRP
jgi:prepilin-type processing-associated H-X9-DG protein